MSKTPPTHFEVEALIEPEHLRLTAHGEYRFDELFGFISLIKNSAEKAGRSRVLIDCLNVRGTMLEAERFSGGKQIAEVFGSRLRAALIMQPEYVTKLGELTAVNRGADFFVTDNEAAALKWLLR